MFEYIKQLQKKPEHVRHRVAIATATILSAFIFLIWLSTFTLDLSKSSDSGALSGVDVSPLANIESALRDIGGIFSGASEALKKVEYSPQSMEGTSTKELMKVEFNAATSTANAQ